MSAELLRIGINAKAPISTAAFDSLWTRFAGEGDTISGKDALRMVTLVAEAVKLDLDPKRQRMLEKVTQREGSSTVLSRTQALGLLHALSLAPGGLRLSPSLASLAAAAAAPDDRNEVEPIRDIYGVVRAQKPHDASRPSLALEPMPVEYLGRGKSPKRRSELAVFGAGQGGVKAEEGDSRRGSQRSTAPAAPLTPMSAAEDFVSLAAALILLLPVDRAAHAALFDPSRLAALSWGVSEAYNRDSVELLSVIYTFETKEHPVHFAFVEEYRSLSEVLLDRFALKLRDLLPPDLAMAPAFAVLTSPLEFMSSIGCRAPIGQPLRWRASFTQAVQRAFAVYCDAHVTLLETASDSSAASGKAPDQEARHTARLAALLTELYECEATHLPTFLQHWGRVTDESLVGTVLRNELRERRTRLQQLVAVQYAMRLSAMTLSTARAAYVSLTADLTSLRSMLPNAYFVRQLLPDLVAAIGSTLRSILLGMASSMLDLEGQVAARELLDHASDAILASVRIEDRDEITKPWIRARLPYRVSALLCSPSDALIRTLGHRDGAADADDIVTVLRSRTTDAAAQAFVREYAPISLPTQFEHRQHASTGSEMRALLTEALPVFGVPLAEAVSRRPTTVRGVPSVLTTCGDVLRARVAARGAAADGELLYIFRESADHVQVTKLVKSLDEGRDVIWDRVTVREVSGVLRRFLNQLPQPLIPRGLYERCLSARASVQLIRDLIKAVPPDNAATLTYLCNLLNDLTCAFDLSVVSVIFRPVILRAEAETPESVARDRTAVEEFTQALIACIGEIVAN